MGVICYALLVNKEIGFVINFEFYAIEKYLMRLFSFSNND